MFLGIGTHKRYLFFPFFVRLENKKPIPLPTENDEGVWLTRQ